VSNIESVTSTAFVDDKTEIDEFPNLKPFIDSLSSDERRVFKSVLSSQIPRFFDDKNRLTLSDNEATREFRILSEALRYLSPQSKQIPFNGVAYFGRPSWVTDDLLGRLQEEAQKRRMQPLDRTDHFLGCGGALADQTSTSTTLCDFVAQHVGPCQPTGIASYIYYDKPGLGIRPHVDTDVFSVNVMLMLKHQHSDLGEQSATVIFPSDGCTQYYRLAIGEVMVMYGSSVIHARTLLAEAEQVHLLTFGFNACPKNGSTSPQST